MSKSGGGEKAAVNVSTSGIWDDSEYVTLTVHRKCAQDFLFALNLALGGGGGKKKNGKKGGGSKK